MDLISGQGDGQLCDKNILNATLLNMTTIVSSTLRCHPVLDAAAFFDCLGYESVFLPLPG